MKRIRGIFIMGGVAVGSIVAGCGLGYNRMLFFTGTNFGLNIDSTPPTAEISVGRREGVIAPAFEGDKVPPVLGMFRSDGNFFSPALTSVFAGGSAAATVTGKPDGTGRYCVANPPRSRMLAFWSAVPGVRALTEVDDTARPFIFATDTMTGLKAVWSGAGGAVPETVKFGYNRKESAYAPVFSEPGTTPGATPGAVPSPICSPGQSEVKNPSFLATAFTSTELSVINDSGFRYVQTFATGTAADNLAAREDIQRTLTQKMLPTEVVGPLSTATPVQPAAAATTTPTTIATPAATTTPPAS